MAARLPIKVIVGVDYGTTFTKISYALVDSATTPANAEVEFIAHWPPATSNPDIPSYISYPEDNLGFDLPHPGIQWGQQVQSGMRSSSWTKALLDPETQKAAFETDLKILDDAAAWGTFHMPEGKGPIEIGGDFLGLVYKHVYGKLEQELPGLLHRLPIEFRFTMPRSWPDETQAAMTEAARRAGFGQRHQDQLITLAESEAAALATFHTFRDVFRDGDGVLICDCGGGAVDITSYYVASIAPRLLVNELSSRRGTGCGGTALDRKLYELLSERFGRAFETLPSKLKAPGSELMEHFENIKRRFHQNNWEKFRIPLQAKFPKAKPSHFDSKRCQLLLTSVDIRLIFQDVVREILDLIRSEIDAVTRKWGRPIINRIVLVGGFGESDWLRNEVFINLYMPGEIEISKYPAPGLAVAKGAALYGIYGPFKGPRDFPQSYGFEITRAFQPGNDDEKISFVDEVSGEKMASGIASWAIVKDAQYHPDYVFSQELVLHYRTGEMLTRAIPIFSCDSPYPPSQIIPGHVSPVGYMVVDFSGVDLARFVHRTVAGGLVYRIRLQVDVGFGHEPGILSFTARSLGMVIGEWQFSVLVPR